MNHVEHSTAVLRYLKKQTDSVILFYSAGGKDSLVILDLLAPHFKQVHCVFMYFLPNMQHNRAYIKHIGTYKNTTFHQYPHFGISADLAASGSVIKQFKLDDIVKVSRKDTGAEWCVFGWKMSDNMYRRVILNTYKFNSINEKTKRIYPLAMWTKQNTIDYIKIKNLPEPLNYGSKTSSGMGLTENFLVWLRTFYPEDLKEVTKVYPVAGSILFEYDYRTSRTPEISDSPDQSQRN